jgi:Uma2 family endonuclease
MSAVREARATLDDLYATPGKAELIGGRIVEVMPTGFQPNQVTGSIYVSLRTYAKECGKGVACTDGIGFAIEELPSGRESFSPDVSYYDGVLPGNVMRFIEGAPAFAAEVRSERDYGASAESKMADKRADYFAAGTQVVWDVDPQAECVHVYKSADPNKPITYRRGQMAEAEPAVPGWRVAVDSIFD